MNSVEIYIDKISTTRHRLWGYALATFNIPVFDAVISDLS
jgi:hypothetical protein